MKFPHSKQLLRIGLGLAAVVLAFGCSKKPMSLLQQANRAPEVRLTSAPVDTSGLYYYSYTVDWVGFDPDGRVDHFLYTIDPQNLHPGEDTAWVNTTANEQRLFFKSKEPLRDAGGRLLGRDFHIFLIKAVDDKGLAGPYVARAFYSYTVAPSVRITNPATGAYKAFVTPSVRISWTGEDPDGVFTTKPVKYKYILLSQSSEFPRDLAIFNPDSLRRYYQDHPLGPWAGWDSTSAETTQVQFTNLTPGNLYVFVVIAFDEAGAYSPLFDFTSNMIKLQVGFAGVLGPKITMFNEFFNFSYKNGSYNLSDAAQVKLEVPSKQFITVNWSAEPPEGADIIGFRWGLDIENVFDNTPRTNELTDIQHWSTQSNVMSATVGPFRGGETHFFFVEAEDNNGLKSLGILRMTVVESKLEKPLLLVDDTRLRVDTRSTGQSCMDLPTGPWPTRSEMDTFFVARGNQPWSCYPPGLMPTLPGVFSGYGDSSRAYMPDTIGTRIGRADLTVHLSILGHYAHILWMTDGLGAALVKPGTDLVGPMDALRYMGGPGRVNTLAAYVKQGGQVWLAGGGAGYAISDPFNDPSNDQPTKTYSFSSPRHELGPGRFMYDVAHWQSEFRVARPAMRITKATGRFRDRPDYAGLPDMLEPKAPDTDPIELEAPTRSTGNLYITTESVEFLQQPNFVQEDINPDPDIEDIESTLDTLYRVSAATLPDPGDFPGSGIDPRANPAFPVMTYYHGPAPQNTKFIMSGFPVYFFKRPQVQQLVDYVCQNIWGLVKHPTLMPARANLRRMAPAKAVSKLPSAAIRTKPLALPHPRSPQIPRD